MSLKNRVIQRLKKIAGEAKVLTDAEDLYVYSFEQFFNERRRYPKLDAVIRVDYEKQAEKILELARKESVDIFRRSSKNIEALQANPKVTVLIDDVPQRQLDALSGMEEKRPRNTELEDEIRRAGHGSFRNFALALKSFFSGLPAKK